MQKLAKSSALKRLMTFVGKTAWWHVQGFALGSVSNEKIEIAVFAFFSRAVLTALLFKWGKNFG